MAYKIIYSVEAFVFPVIFSNIFLLSLYLWNSTKQLQLLWIVETIMATEKDVQKWRWFPLILGKIICEHKIFPWCFLGYCLIVLNIYKTLHFDLYYCSLIFIKIAASCHGAFFFFLIAFILPWRIIT